MEDVFTQQKLEEFCTAKSPEGITFTKEPVFMLPLETLRAVFEMPGYGAYFKDAIFRLVGAQKEGHVMYSHVHDFLVIAGLDREGMAYPDMIRTSRLKQPIPISELPLCTIVAAEGSTAEGRLPAVVAAEGSTAEDGAQALHDDSDAAARSTDYPFREGDFEDIVTLQLFAEPVVTNTGYIMDRSSFENLVRSGKACPLSRRPLTTSTPVTRGSQEDYALHNGPAKLGGWWSQTLQSLQREAGLREFARIRSIRLYDEFKALISRTLEKELGDDEFVHILRDVLNMHISSASPSRRMATGSELFGPGQRVLVSQFRKTEQWPKDGDSDFFVVLPQPTVEMPYCIPVAGNDENGLPFPANYYRVTPTTLVQQETPVASTHEPSFTSL